MRRCDVHELALLVIARCFGFSNWLIALAWAEAVPPCRVGWDFAAVRRHHVTKHPVGGCLNTRNELTTVLRREALAFDAAASTGPFAELSTNESS
jgi:hypothetical protein